MAAGAESPDIESTLDTIRRQINRIVRVNSAIAFVEEHLHNCLESFLFAPIRAQADYSI